MSRPVGAHLKGELLERYEEAEEAAAEENKSAFLRSVIDDGLQVREGDALDAIDASDELRAAVEAEREAGEDVNAAVRRLLADGVANTRTAQLQRLGGARTIGVGIALLAAAIATLSVVAVVSPGETLALAALFGALAFTLAALGVTVAALLANVALARPLLSTAVAGLRRRLGSRSRSREA